MAFVVPIAASALSLRPTVNSKVCVRPITSSACVRKTFVFNPLKATSVVRKVNAVKFSVVASAAEPSIQERIQAEIQKARAVSAEKGEKSTEAAAAWDAVEELEAELSHQKAKVKKVDPMEKFCEENPDAEECRVYDE